MKNQNKLISKIDTEEAAVIAGAISGYLGHRKFSIKSVKIVNDFISSDNKTNWKKKLLFSTWKNGN